MKRLSQGLRLLAGLALACVARGNMTQFCDANTYVFHPLTEQNSYELVQVSIVTRHGDRAPYTIMGGAGTSSTGEVWDMCDFYDHVSTEFGTSENYQKIVIPTNLPFSKKVKNNQTNIFHLSFTFFFSTCGWGIAF